MKKIILILVYWLITGGVQAQTNITRAEYFFNTDPGFGNGINIPISAAPDISNVNFAANIAALSQGINRLFIRSRDAAGKWSITNRFSFLKISSTAAPGNINRAEYFFDTDPGFGNGTSIPITPATDVVNNVFAVNLSGLTSGLHQLYIRSRDVAGKWSVTNRFLLVKASISSSTSIAAAEYFIDTDPGFGNGVPIAINSMPDLADVNIFTNITGLSAAVHHLYIRSMDINKKWSITNNISFSIAAPVAAPAIVVNSITESTRCGAESFDIGYHVTGTYTPGNIFSVQLSDATGSFTNPVIIGSLAGTANNIVKCIIPVNIANGTQYRVRVVSSNPVVTGLASNNQLTLRTQPFFNDTTVYVSCANETFNLAMVYNTTGFTTAWNAPNPAAAPVDTFRLIASNNTCIDTAFVIVQQDVAKWTGAVNNDWHTAGNWSTLRVPSDKTNVIIASGTVNITTANAAAASVQIKPGAILNVQANRSCIVSKQCNPLPTGL